MSPQSAKFLRVEVWSNRCLASPERGASLLKRLRSMDGGRWVPQRWNAVEPVRKPFSETSEEEIVRSWTEERPPGSGEVFNYLYFRRSKPSAFIDCFARRLGRGGLNRVYAEFAAKPFLTPDGPDRVKELLREFVVWSDAAYGAAFYSAQAHRRGAMGTPLKRLENAHWLNFFGQPYIDLFGRDRILSVPCQGVEEIPGHGLLVQAAPRFDSPEMVDSPDALLALEAHLGTDAFVGYGVPCRVPEFDLSDTQLLKNERDWTLGSAEWETEPAAPDDPSVSADLDRLLTMAVRFAQSMLAQHGEFHPFGASMGTSGEAALAGAHPGNMHASSREAAEFLLDGLAHQARQGEIRAAAICLDVRKAPPRRSKKVDVIAVRLEHSSGASAVVFLPYRKDPFGDYAYDEPFAARIDPELFVGPNRRE